MRFRAASKAPISCLRGAGRLRGGFAFVARRVDGVQVLRRRVWCNLPHRAIAATRHRCEELVGRRASTRYSASCCV